MKAGVLKEKIKILRNEFVKNRFGEETECWTEVYNTRAELKHDTGSRLNVNNEILYSAIKTFKIRYYVDVDDFDRVEWNGKQYRIISIEPDVNLQCKYIKTERVDD